MGIKDLLERQPFLNYVADTLAQHPEWCADTIHAITDGLRQYADEAKDMRASATAVAQLLIKTKADAEYVNKFCNRDMWAKNIVEWIDMKLNEEGKANG